MIEKNRFMHTPHSFALATYQDDLARSWRTPFRNNNSDHPFFFSFCFALLCWEKQTKFENKFLHTALASSSFPRKTVLSVTVSLFISSPLPAVLLFFVFRTPLSSNNSEFFRFPAIRSALLSRSSLSFLLFFAQSCCTSCVLSSHVISLSGSCRAFRKRKRGRVSVVYSAYKLHVLRRSFTCS